MVEDVRRRIAYQSPSSNLARNKALRRLSSLPEKQFTRFLITHHKLICSKDKRVTNVFLQGKHGSSPARGWIEILHNPAAVSPQKDEIGGRF